MAWVPPGASGSRSHSSAHSRQVCKRLDRFQPSSTPMRLVPRGKGLVAASDEPPPRLGADDVRALVEAVRR